MKKSLSVLTAALLAVSLAGCGGGKKEAPKASQAQSSVPVQPLKYKVLKLEDSSIPVRRRARALIMPISPDNEINQMSLTATCMGAAKYLANDGIQMIGVFVVDRAAENPLDQVQLARCDYAPDGKGVSGKDNWTWGAIMATNGTTSAEYKKFQDTWASLRNKYADKYGVINDEGPITKEVAKKMGKTVKDIDQIALTMPMLNKVNITPELENISATAPEK